MLQSSPIPIRPYTQTQLAAIYGVSSKVFSRWLLALQPRLGRRPGRYFTALQVFIIFDELGIPGLVIDASDQLN